MNAMCDFGRSEIDAAIQRLTDLTHDLPIPRNGRAADDPTPQDQLKREVSAHINAARECLRKAQLFARKSGPYLADKEAEHTSDDIRAFLDQTCEELMDVGISVYGLNEFDDTLEIFA